MSHYFTTFSWSQLPQTVVSTSKSISLQLPQQTPFTSLHLNTTHQQLTENVCGAAQIVPSACVNTTISSVPHQCDGTCMCSSWQCHLLSVPVPWSGVPHYCDGTCMCSSWQCHLLSVPVPSSGVPHYCEGTCMCSSWQCHLLSVSSAVSTNVTVQLTVSFCQYLYIFPTIKVKPSATKQH